VLGGAVGGCEVDGTGLVGFLVCTADDEGVGAGSDQSQPILLHLPSQGFELMRLA
jgi:hypothetical protein